MIFFYDSSGKLINSTLERLQQGSHLASRIWFIMPTSPTNEVYISFTAPNGRYLSPKVMTSITGQNGLTDGNDKIVDQNGQVCDAWFYDVEKDVTTYAGKLELTFTVITATGQEIKTDSPTITVAKGSQSNILPIPKTQYEELLQRIAEVKLDVVNVDDKIKSLNIKNGEPKNTIVQDVTKEESKNKVYQEYSVTFGAKHTIGRTKEEFDAYYWDDEKNEPKNGGRKDNDGSILDNNGKKYEESQLFAFTTGLQNKNKAFCAAVFGGNNDVEGKTHIVGGTGNKVRGAANLVDGGNNEVDGNYNIVDGLQNKVDGQSNIVNGNENVINSNYALVVGNKNETADNRNVTVGYGNIVKHEASAAFGAELETSTGGQTVVGYKNALNDEARFIVGNGDNNGRKNAFVVLDDGRAKIQTSPRENDDVVDLKTLNEKITAVYKVKGSVPTIADLPTTATVGDVYNIVNTGINYVYTESGWDALGNITGVETDKTLTKEGQPADAKATGDALAKKIGFPTTATGGSFAVPIVYAMSNIMYRTAATGGIAGNIPFYGDDTHGKTAPSGKLVTNDPTQPYHAATKNYVDNNAGGKVYKHTMHVFTENWINDIMLTGYSTKDTPISATQIPDMKKTFEGTIAYDTFNLGLLYIFNIDATSTGVTISAAKLENSERVYMDLWFAEGIEQEPSRPTEI